MAHPSRDGPVRYDGALVRPTHRHVWGRDGRNSFTTLRALNPDIVLAIYASDRESTTPPTGGRSRGLGVAQAETTDAARGLLDRHRRKTGAYLQGIPYRTSG